MFNGAGNDLQPCCHGSPTAWRRRFPAIASGLAGVGVLSLSPNVPGIQAVSEHVQMWPNASHMPGSAGQGEGSDICCQSGGFVRVASTAGLAPWRGLGSTRPLTPTPPAITAFWGHRERTLGQEVRGSWRSWRQSPSWKSLQHNNLYRPQECDRKGGPFLGASLNQILQDRDL